MKNPSEKKNETKNHPEKEPEQVAEKEAEKEAEEEARKGGKRRVGKQLAEKAKAAAEKSKEVHKKFQKCHDQYMKIRSGKLFQIAKALIKVGLKTIPQVITVYNTLKIIHPPLDTLYEIMKMHEEFLKFPGAKTIKEVVFVMVPGLGKFIIWFEDDSALSPEFLLSGTGLEGAPAMVKEHAEKLANIKKQLDALGISLPNPIR